MVDMDDTDDVVGASSFFARAITSNTGHISGAAGDFGLLHRPESELDDGQVAVCSKMVSWFLDAGATRDDHSAATAGAVRDAAVTIGNTDVDNGAHVRSV